MATWCYNLSAVIPRHSLLNTADVANAQYLCHSMRPVQRPTTTELVAANAVTDIDTAGSHFTTTVQDGAVAQSAT